MLMQRVEMGEQLIATDLSCGVHQPGLKNEQGNDLVVGRSCGCPGGVVIEAKVSPEPNHARSWIGTVHGPSMNQARTYHAVGPEVSAGIGIKRGYGPLRRSYPFIEACS